MKNSLLLLFVAVSFVGCSSIAKVSVAPNYQARAHRIAILPFEVHGHPDRQTDESLADHLGTALIEDGLTVIDRQAVGAEAKRQGLDITSNPSPDVLAKLSQALNIDGFFMGTVNYRYEGPSAGTDPVSVSTSTDKKGNIRDVSVSGGGSYSNSGGYLVSDMSARLISARDYETLVSAYVPGYHDSEMIEEIKDKMKVGK